jgi:hypothetical protein
MFIGTALNLVHQYPAPGPDLRKRKRRITQIEQLNKNLASCSQFLFSQQPVAAAGKHALTADTQNAGDDEAQHPIHRDEKKAGEQDHEKNKPRRDQGLAARRPRHLGAFGADLLKEFQRVSHFFGVPFLVCGPFKVAPIREKAARIGKGAIPVTFRSRLRKADKRHCQKIRARNPKATRRSFLL